MVLLIQWSIATVLIICAIVHISGYNMRWYKEALVDLALSLFTLVILFLSYFAI